MRQFLLLGVPLLIPLGLYMLWFTRAVARARAEGSPPPGLGDVPWATLAGAGVALAGVCLGAWHYGGGAPANTHYEPPRLIGGQVVPGGAGKP